MDLWNHVICHYYILHLRLSVCCCRSVMCSNRYKYFDHLKQLSHVEQFVHLDTGSGPNTRITDCNKYIGFLFYFSWFYGKLSCNFRLILHGDSCLHRCCCSVQSIYLLGMNYFCWMWLFSALYRSVEIFDAECPTKRDTIAIPLSHVKPYFGHHWLILFDEHRVILDPFQILAEVNRMLAMLPGSLDFVMLLMHSIGVCVYVYVNVSVERIGIFMKKW